MAQINARIPDEVAAALDRWASESGVERATLVRDVLSEAVTARGQGRASFERPETVDPADVQRLIVDVRGLKMELARVLEQNAKRDAALVKSARADSVGVSEARTAIVSRLVAELQQVRDAVLDATAKLSAEQATALAASPALAAVVSAVNAQAKVLREYMAKADRWFEQPRTQVRYTVWDRDWSGRRVGATLVGIWSLCVASYFFLAMLLPGPWLAVRSANTLLGGGDQAVCALVNYRLATDSCRTQFEGRPGRMVVRAMPGAPEGKL
ncbi:hypothetical protein [Sphingomonas bacterium]|uniref:hypothetical protein n=1 Tax=Sphingomonas bacterium TaxID=1895847 RepID=UPI00157776A0|nr:hypothetical protein [Sphingomonas bacterium]